MKNKNYSWLFVILLLFIGYNAGCFSFGSGFARNGGQLSFMSDTAEIDGDNNIVVQHSDNVAVSRTAEPVRSRDDVESGTVGFFVLLFVGLVVLWRAMGAGGKEYM